jgi:hypothetical protein
LKPKLDLNKLLLWCLIALSLLFITGSLLITYWEPVLKKHIKESIYTSTDKLYRVEFDDIGFNVFTGSLSIKNLQLIPDMAIYRQLKSKKQHPRYLFNLYIQKFKFSGINIYDLYFHDELQIDELSINHPDVLVINDATNNEQSDTNSSLRHPYELIKNELKSLQLDQINLKNINFEFISDSLSKRKSHKLFLAYFKVRNLSIDSNSKNNIERPFYSDDIKVSIKNYALNLRDSVNKMQFEEVVASTASSSIEIYNFKIIPLSDIENFKSRDGYRKTRIDLYIREAKLTGIDFKKLFYDQEIKGKSIQINKLKTYISQNNQIAQDPNKIRRFPPELVYDIKIPFYFNDVQIKNSELNYSEKDLKTNYIWNISFNSLNGTINNFTNNIDQIKNNQKVNIEIESLLNNKAHTKLYFTLDYLDKKQPFYVKGLIKNYNIKNLNPILANLASLEVANCDMRNLKFTMQGDKTKMHSNVTMLYNNLRVRILEKNSGENKLKKNAWFSFLANSVLLNNDNPRFNGKTIHPKFHINYHRDYSFFGYIWKALFKGVKESTGVTELMEREIKQRTNRIKEIKAYKEIRKARKEIRKARRSERKKLSALNSSNTSSSEKQL